MTFTSEQRQALETLRKEYRIVFSKDTDREIWPQNHKSVFKAVQTLGRIDYDGYATNEQSSDQSEPWKYQAKGLAKKLTERAEQCVRRNEASWRFACEPLVFSRFGAEVACPNCRKRVWRSSIEATPFSDDRRAEQLRRRQHKREPCCCPRNTRPQDMEEAIGLNRIFIDRAQDPVIHDHELMKKLPKGEQPDRIYGLRQTRNFEDMLYTSHEENKLVRDMVKSSPLSEEGHPLLFPFLLVEAKSSKSADDWHSIKLQTAFPIYTCLEVQQSLQQATRQKSKWEVEPLVWFFMSKGEDWGLCAAFKKDRASSRGLSVSPETHIVELWRGCIESRDSALQLFLIVDYICDWARDIYRPAVLNELKTLSSPDTCEIETIYADSDIFSSREVFSHPSHDEQFTQDNEGQSREKAAFHALGSPYGMVRHASFIESEFYALVITSDNVNTLLQSTQEKVVAYFSRQILGQLQSKSLLLEPEHLAAIENKWTGATRISSRFNMTQSEFYSVITLTSYLTVSWEQVRELCIIAVAKDAFDALVVSSNLRPGRGNTRPPQTLDIDKNLVVAAISHLKGGSVRHNLLAAINRVAVRVDVYGLLGTKSSSFCADDAITWQVVHYVYKSLKKGRLEPTESFLRVSKRMDKQSFDYSNQRPFRFDEELFVSNSMAILLHGECHAYDGRRDQESSLCVYLLNESLDAPNKDDLAAIIKETFQDRDVYHTTRDNGRLNLKPTRYSKVPWNLENTYGVHFSYGRRSFQKWLSSLNASQPTRQGSPRDCSDSGRYLLDREYSPWHDPRLMNGGPRATLRKKFIQELIAAEYRFWRNIAQERYKEGVQCCACCAENLDGRITSDDTCDDTCHDTCDRCYEELEDPDFPRWFGHELVKGVHNRMLHDRGDTIPEEGPTEYNIATPKASPFIFARRGGISDEASLEDDLTSDLSNLSDSSDDSIALASPNTSKSSAVVSLQSADESSQPTTPTNPLKKRKRSGD